MLHYVVIVHKSYDAPLRKLIADQALPLELKQQPCGVACDGKGNCIHKNYNEVWTWIADRREELRNMLLSFDFTEKT